MSLLVNERFVDHEYFGVNQAARLLDDAIGNVGVVRGNKSSSSITSRNSPAMGLLTKCTLPAHIAKSGSAATGPSFCAVILALSLSSSHARSLAIAGSRFLYAQLDARRTYTNCWRLTFSLYACCRSAWRHPADHNPHSARMMRVDSDCRGTVGCELAKSARTTRLTFASMRARG